MNKLKKWAFGGAKDSDYHGDTSSYYGHEHDGAEYTDAALPVNKVNHCKRTEATTLSWQSIK